MAGCNTSVQVLQHKHSDSWSEGNRNCCRYIHARAVPTDCVATEKSNVQQYLHECMSRAVHFKEKSLSKSSRGVFVSPIIVKSLTTPV